MTVMSLLFGGLAGGLLLTAFLFLPISYRGDIFRRVFGVGALRRKRFPIAATGCDGVWRTV